MSDSTRVLSQLAHLEIFKISGHEQIDLKGWLANQQYFVDSITSSTEFRLTVRNTGHLKIALSNDCNRMAMAAIESISGIQKDSLLPQSSSWGIIRAYYASFFAVHSLLRIFGISCSQLNANHLNKVMELAKAQNIQGTINSLENGFYEIQISRDFSSVNFNKKKDSHKDTWGCFLSLIDQLEQNLSKTTAISKHKDAARDLLIQVKNGITRSGNRDKGNWLSEIRNKVNYQHLYGAWFPYEDRILDGNFIDSASKSWRNNSKTFNTENRSTDIEIFFELTAIILSMFRELLFECVEKINSTNKIFSNGTFRLFNQLKQAPL